MYDSVGATTFERVSTACARAAIWFSSANRVVRFRPSTPANSQRKDHCFSRARLSRTIHLTAQNCFSANDLFNWTASGKLKLRIENTFALKGAADAHRLMEGRKTTGKIVLLP